MRAHISRTTLIVGGLSLLLVGLIVLSLAAATGGAPGSGVVSGKRPEWQSIPFVNVRTNETVKLSDFAGKTVVVEVFSVWCENCLRQQQEASLALTKLGKDAPIYISLNLDIAHPNDNAKTVQDYVERYQFPWIYAISNKQFTDALIDQFGFNILNAPIMPVFVISPNGTASQLYTGLHRADELIGMIQDGSGMS